MKDLLLGARFRLVTKALGLRPQDIADEWGVSLRSARAWTSPTRIATPPAGIVDDVREDWAGLVSFVRDMATKADGGDVTLTVPRNGQRADEVRVMAALVALEAAGVPCLVVYEGDEEEVAITCGELTAIMGGISDALPELVWVRAGNTWEGGYPGGGDTRRGLLEGDTRGEGMSRGGYPGGGTRTILAGAISSREGVVEPALSLKEGGVVVDMLRGDGLLDAAVSWMSEE